MIGFCAASLRLTVLLLSSFSFPRRRVLLQALFVDFVCTDGAEKSRLDLVVRDPEHSALIDVVVFYPVQPCGRKLYRHGVHER